MRLSASEKRARAARGQQRCRPAATARAALLAAVWCACGCLGLLAPARAGEPAAVGGSVETTAGTVAASQPGPDALTRALEGGRPPSEAAARAAFAAARAALDAWSIPKPDAWTQGEQAAALAGLERGVSGVFVRLRLDGQVLGAGRALGEEPGAVLLARALAEAMREADGRLPAGHDALRPERLAVLGRTVALSLELAGPRTPVELEAFEDAARVVTPGLTGLALIDGEGTAGERVVALSPAMMMERGWGGPTAARSLVVELGGDARLALDGLPAARRGRAWRWSAFRVTHVAQWAEAEGAALAKPVRLHRGDVPVPLGAMNAAGVRAMTIELVEHVIARSAAEGGAEAGRAGEAADAAAEERALAALALARWARAERGRGEIAAADAERADRAERAAASLAVGALATEPLGTATAGLLVLAAGELSGRGAAEVRGVQGMDRAERAVRGAFDVERGFAENLSIATRAVVAAALADLATRAGAAAEERGIAERALRRLLTETPQAGLVSAMPFAAWAERRLAGEGPLPAAAALRQVRAEVWRNQIGPVSAEDDRVDLVGGVVLADAEEGGRLGLPTAAGLRALALGAWALGDDGLTEPGERGAETARVAMGLRFVRQIQVREPEAGWASGTAGALRGGLRARPGVVVGVGGGLSGGVRGMPLGASAMGLVVLTDAGVSLGRVAAAKSSK